MNEEWPDIDDAFGHWFAGFFDGEGHLGIHPDASGRAKRAAKGLGPRWRAVAAITLRADDSEIIEQIRRRFGFGAVTHSRANPRRPNCKAEITWYVSAKHDCASLARFFERYPLRAKKARDLAIWSEAVRVIAAPPSPSLAADRGLLKRPRVQKIGRPGTRSEAEWDAVAALAAALRAARLYGGSGEGD